LFSLRIAGLLLRGASFFVFLCCLVAGASAEELRLVDLIDSVRGRGHSIVYSTDLVHSGMRVEVDERSLESLRQALPALGLRLEGAGDTLLIRRGPTIEAPTPRIIAATAELETVIVTGSRHRFPRSGGAVSGRRFAARDLTGAPSLASDPARAMLRVPGISSVGVSAKPHIRGGLQDELLILQDGIELVEPFHLADYHSAYSALNYHTVESVDFYTGGFPSRYGNRMSGVMDITHQWLDRPFQTELGVSSFATFIDTQQPLPVGRDGSLGVSYRQGDLADLADYFDTRTGTPEYRDAALRMHTSLSEHTTLYAGLAYAEDDILFEDLGERASSQIDSWYGWLRVDMQPDDSFRGRLSLSVADFARAKTQVNAEIEDDPEDPGSFLDYRQDLQRFSVRNDYFWLRGPVIHEFGWQLEYGRADYRNRSRIDRGELAEIIGTENEVEYDLRQRPSGWSGGAYWTAEWQLADRWLLQPGLRWDFQDYYLASDADYQLAPRLGVVFDALPSLDLRLSLGRFYQPEGLQELQALDGVERFYPAQRSDQFLVGAEWTASQWQAVLEVYYKNYANPKGRFENVFNPFVLLPEMESDRLGIFPDKARARGIDLDLSYQFTEGLSAQFRYSYMDAQDRLEGRWVDRRWSQEQTVNASLRWRRDNFSVAIAALWHSGWRTTRLPGFIADDNPIDILDFLNNDELREHFSVDVSARYRWEFPNARIEIYADLSNVTDRQNLAGVDFDEEEVEGGYLILPDKETLLGFVPSIGITLSF
jgi:outer membrane receptor protein involved in Fe transport